MAAKASAPSTAQAAISAGARASWLPMIIILLAQIQMAFNVNALPVSIGPIVETLDTPATMVGTALVVYSLCVAAFVMLGAKLGKLFGERLVFQITVVIHGLAMGLMAISPDARVMIAAQALAGLAAAALVPTLVVLVAANYHGDQQAQALGLLAGAPAMAGVLAFLLAGYLGTAFSWRYSFGLILVLSLAVLALSFRLKSVPRQKGVKIDFVGALLIALAMILISLGFNNLNSWGVVMAKDAAPISLFGLSPAPFMVLIGIVFAQGFFTWSHYREKKAKTPLLSLQVLDSSHERSATFSLLIIGALGPAVNFLIPLYIQIVQGRTTLQTSIAVIPYTLAIFTAAVLIVRLYGRLAPRTIGMIAFITVSIGLTVLAFTISNDWGTPVVILGLVILGLGEGALVTLLFNVLVTASPKELAGDVGALRGTTNNLSTALGTAFASVVAVGLLSLFILGSVGANPLIPLELKAQVNLDSINFISNAQLQEVMAATTATSEQVTEAVRINELARLRALKASFLILAAIALLAIFPARGLPNYVPGEVPTGELTENKTTKGAGKKKAAAAA
ncbi:MAG: MFS transporter [Caldilineaceae bacterium]